MLLISNPCPGPDACEVILLCLQHKTVETYGADFKDGPSGAMEAVRVYLELPGKLNGLFLKVAKPLSKRVSFRQRLHRFAICYLPDYAPSNCNLISKQFHTMLIRSSREQS